VRRRAKKLREIVLFFGKWRIVVGIVINGNGGTDIGAAFPGLAARDAAQQKGAISSPLFGQVIGMMSAPR
jgi:hypothetical protein